MRSNSDRWGNALNCNFSGGVGKLVYGGEGRMRYAMPDPANPTGTWKIHNVSERQPPAGRAWVAAS